MTYELIYPDGQETIPASLSEARVIAKGFVEKHVEHLTVGGSRKTYTVKAAHFDPTRGIVLTSTTGETFVHIGLGKPGKALPPARVKKGKPKTRPGRPRKSASKAGTEAAPPVTMPAINVSAGIKSMFKAGMGISKIADVFEVEPEFIEDLLREAMF